MKKYLIILAFACILLLSATKTAFNTATNDLQNKAAESKKNIVVYFCGSDWCSLCNNFKKGFLSNTNVDALLKNDYVYYIADFPQRKKLEKSVVQLNESLAEKLNTEGHFPKLVIADDKLHIKAVILQSEAFETAYAKLQNNIKK
jgi:thioredoxin-related protein